MRDGILLSTLFHVVVLLAAIFGLPAVVEPRVFEEAVPVELVVLEEEAPEPKPEPPKAEEPDPKPEPPKQEAKPQPEPPAPEPPQPEPPEPEVQPEPPAPEPPPPPKVEKPEPVPTPEAKAEPEPEPEPAPPIPKPKPQVKKPEPPKKEEPKPDSNRLASILKNVDQLRKDQPPPSETTAKAPEPAPQQQVASAMERSALERALREQIQRCWRLDPGAVHAEDLVVELRVFLNPDGTARLIEIVDVERMTRDAYFNSAAENARRAVLTCQPFKLDPHKYEVWRELILRFDPREMFGT